MWTARARVTTPWLVVALALCGTLSTCPAAPDTGASRDLALLRQIPYAVLRQTGSRPDEQGLVGHNRRLGWVGVAFQRGAMGPLRAAVAHDDAAMAADQWRAVDAAFARQLPEGNFAMGSYEGRQPSRRDDLSNVAFWLHELAHALLVVEASRHEPAWRDRLSALRPRVRLAARWAYEGRRELAERADVKAPNRLLIDALAFALGGQWLDDAELREAGGWFANRALALQREDGVFIEGGGADSSYQAVCVLKLQLLALYAPDPRYEQPLARAARWEMGRVRPDGEVDTSGNTRVHPGGEKLLGREKGVDYGAVMLGLWYYGLLHDDADAVATARRVARHRGWLSAAP